MTKEEWAEQERNEEAIRAENKGLLAGFKDWLTAKKLISKTINKNIQYTQIYMDYLLRYDTLSSKNYQDLGGFADFCERKVLGGNLKTAYASLKRYYAFLYENRLADDKIMNEVAAAEWYFD